MRVMMIIVLFLFLGCASNSVVSSQDVEIETLCHCQNDCNRQDRCGWVWEKFSKIASGKVAEVSGNKALKIVSEEKFSLIEMVDSGGYGCFTTFGIIENRGVRVDIELWNKEGIVEVGSVKFEYVDRFPSLYERKKDISAIDDLCVFKFDD